MATCESTANYLNKKDMLFVLIGNWTKGCLLLHKTPIIFESLNYLCLHREKIIFNTHSPTEYKHTPVNITLIRYLNSYKTQWKRSSCYNFFNCTSTSYCGGYFDRRGCCAFKLKANCVFHKRHWPKWLATSGSGHAGGMNRMSSLLRNALTHFHHQQYHCDAHSNDAAIGKHLFCLSRHSSREIQLKRPLRPINPHVWIENRYWQRSSLN